MPRALRVSPSTTAILVKDVHSRSSDGATPTTVSSTMSWTTRLGSPGTPTVTVGSVGVAGGLGSTGPMVAGTALTWIALVWMELAWIALTWIAVAWTALEWIVLAEADEVGDPSAPRVSSAMVSRPAEARMR